MQRMMKGEKRGIEGKVNMIGLEEIEKLMKKHARFVAKCKCYPLKIS